MSKRERMAIRREEMRRLAEEIADRRDFAVLEDLARARRHMQSAIEGTLVGERQIALMRAIDAYAEILTGDREYFWSKPYSAAERSRDQEGS